MSRVENVFRKKGTALGLLLDVLARAYVPCFTSAAAKSAPRSVVPEAPEG